jgi:DNA-binding response OmpR family regulator
MRLLLVEDSKFLQKPLIAGLKASGYAIDAASDGEEGLWMARTYEYDVIVLDLMLPKLDGYQVLEALRHDGSETPVLILSARDSIEDRVRGLQRGADDYLVKPFAFEELSARIHNLTRLRYAKHTSILRVADLEIDTATKTARRGGITLTLAPKQFALLEYLMHSAGTVVSRTEIEAHL